MNYHLRLEKFVLTEKKISKYFLSVAVESEEFKDNLHSTSKK